MKKTNLILWFIFVFCVGAIGGALIATKGLGPSWKKYWVDRKTYDAEVKAWAEKSKASDLRIAEAERTINERAIEIRDLMRKSAEAERTANIAAERRRTAEAETERLRTEAEAVIRCNPAVRRLIENFDLRIREYENEVLSLRTALKTEKDKAEKWEASFYDQQKISREWKATAIEEKRLRLKSDDLRISLEMKFKASKFWTKFWKWTTIGTWSVFGVFQAIDAIRGI